MKFLSHEKLSPHKYKTPEGYLVCVDAILARTGKQTYAKNEIFDCDDILSCNDSEIEVDRRPEEVFSEKAMASFENKPIVVEHPDEEVNVDNYKEYAVGFVRDVHRGCTENGDDVLLGTLVITDAKTIEEIENGEHTDLSCGYDCDVKDEQYPQMRNIRGNHVALCQEGRAGIAKIVDSKDSKIKDIHTYKVIWRDLYAAQKGASREEYQHKDFINANSIKDVIKKLEIIAFDNAVGTYYFDVLSISPNDGYMRLYGRLVDLQKEFVADSNVKDSKLPSHIRNDISKYFNMISTFTNRDTDINDILRPLAGHGYNFTRQDIKGWYETLDGKQRKDYFYKIDGYDNQFMVSLYADPETYKVNEVNAYFIDSKPLRDKKYQIRYNADKNEFDDVVIEADTEEEAIKKFEKKYPRKIFAGSKEIKDFEKISYEPMFKDSDENITRIGRVLSNFTNKPLKIYKRSK